MMKVLIVEDERTLSMIIADTLRDEGFEVVQAYDGNQGISSHAGSSSRRGDSRRDDAQHGRL
jgi:DNA-binding response OmpR family regulator